MRRTARELADAIDATLEGEGSLEITGVAAPERAASRDLIYADSAKHAERAATSAARCVIACEGLGLPGKTVLRTANPKVAFSKAAALLLDRRPIAAGIHPTAVVAPLARVAGSASIGPYAVIGEDAHVGEETEIGAHSVVGAGCWVGENCRIHPRVTLYNHVRIGHRVEIHSGAVIGADGFGYALGDGRQWKFPQVGIVEIGDDVEIGANTAIDRGSLDDTRIAERSEEHTSELQSRLHLVCRLLLEKKNRLALRHSCHRHSRRARRHRTQSQRPRQTRSLLRNSIQPLRPLHSYLGLRPLRSLYRPAS